MNKGLLLLEWEFRSHVHDEGDDNCFDVNFFLLEFSRQPKLKLKKT